MKQKILFVVCLLFGLLFINAGLNKFFNYMPMQKDMPEESVKAFASFMAISWLLPLVGFAEVLGGLLIIIPKTRLIGALVNFPIVIGIILANLSMEPSGLPLAFVLLAIELWVFFENREKLIGLLG